MSDLRPFQSGASAPLTGGARFIRGFTRIGAVMAVLVSVVGLAITAFVANDSYSRETSGYKNARCIAQLARSGYVFKRKYPAIDNQTIDYEVNGCADYGIYGKPVGDVLAIADAPEPTFMTSQAPSTLGLGLMISAASGVVAYVLFWMIGWMLAGFTKEA